MSDFFDKNLLQGIVSGAIILLISIWLGGRAQSSPTTGKGWKITVIFAYVMIFGGLYLFASNLTDGGFNNPYTGMGLSLAILGVILRFIGKFFIWWHH